LARYIALTCEALSRSLYAVAAQSPHTVSIRLYKQGLHNSPKNLRQILREQIAEVKPGECDAILLGYGLCGAATAGLASEHTPLVMARAHDCITLYLGSRERYQAEFDRHPGTYWYSVDYMERQEKGASVALGASGLSDAETQYDEWVKKFGQSMADMLREEYARWTQHYTRAAFIDMGLGDTGPYESMARAKAEQEGWIFERMEGDPRLLRMLVNGEWSEEEFVIVPPGATLQQSFNPEQIVEAKPTAAT
jgi:hypothetical protein